MLGHLSSTKQQVHTHLVTCLSVISLEPWDTAAATVMETAKASSDETLK